MSAPTSGSAGDSPTPGFYPDPSIPGYIRYWNGAGWVPGTSRPAPAEGEAMPAPPPGVAPAPAPAPLVEETGPVFFDEEANGGSVPAVRQSGEVEAQNAVTNWDDPARLHGGSPEPASAWQADASRQGGFGGEVDRRVSWGSPDQPDPYSHPDQYGAQSGTPGGGAAWGAVPPQREERPGGEGPAADGSAADGPTADGSAQTPAAPAPRPSDIPADGTVAIRALKPGAPRPGAGGRPPVDQGTTAIRAVRPDNGGAAAPGSPPAAKGNQTMAIRIAPGGGPSAPAPSGSGAPQALPSVGAQQPPPQQTPPQQNAPSPQRQAPQTPAPQTPAPSAGFPPQGGAAAPGPQGAGAEAHIPWKPPTEDVFFAAAQAQQGHPASLGRRFAARLIDTVVLGAVTAAVAVPMWGTVTDHIDAKVEAAKQSGRQVTVYFLDGTTAPVFGVILAVLLIGGALYEALPTIKWGRTLGKKLCGVRVLDIESHDTPMLGAALKRWFVYGVLGVLVVGIVNAAWCLFDRPWRQCWHDKVARTFVAAD
ncbi:RDD family protein [Streptomyces sp. NPDC093589]|uniref:RDD family protein n=1 Tax=Streptomyces sp. NPDC093589 TaxID=3366043 RepID=UPI0037FD0FBC